MSSGTGDEACQFCKQHELPNYFCIDCGLTFCQSCWSSSPSHASGVVNRDGMAHEKINKQIAARLGKIFTPSSDPEKQRQLHEDDANTTWFGVTRNITGSPILQDYGRYSTVMRESSTGEYAARWPQLVSFVGQTGAGKSTLVKTLIDYQTRTQKTRVAMNFPSPVAGSVNDHSPTSGDVHLYGDPGTYHSQFPVLYADCEGMDGGEKIPMGAKYKHSEFAQPPRPRGRSGSMTSQSAYGLPRKLHKKLNKPIKREIRWATTADKCKREFAVRELYPRLLYAFSDIVVFVLRNDRTFESAALVPMLQWAASSVEGSVNQAALPHAIIVLNFTDPNIHPNGWTVESATNSLLNTYAKAVFDNADVKSYARYWQERDRPVGTTKDLLLCYYSSVSVVRIPQKGRYGLVDTQVAELNLQIQKRCKEARQNRKHLRLMFNTEEFQAALSMGFDHFSNRLDEPFDFVELSWNLNPIPKDFGGNILRLALAIKDDPKMAGASGPEIFQHLGHMVASCVMLDYVRHQIKGTPTRLLDHYKENYSRALKEFCEDWWPCCFQQRGARCVNTQRGHIRGHQDARGRLITTGPYRSANDFTEKGFEADWHAMLTSNLDNIREHMERMRQGDIAMDEETAAGELHLKRMNEFYSNLGELSAYTNHSACFCCLRELPEHPLPCGHVLCTPCVRSFGRRKNRVTYALESCPLHDDQKWDQEWEIPVKPGLAGVRILTLDGGGVRGIVELEVLAEIQRHLGRLKIGNFFDLIVGTSTGGLVALGLGVKNWSVEFCAGQFQNLCRKAFTPREFHNVPILEQLSTLNHKGKYKTRPFKDALKEAFQEDQLFGGVCEEARYQRKVAVVSTTDSGQQAVIFTNYNRLQRDAEPDYKFERPEKGHAELKIWEAGRATSAATSYFKPFENERTGLKYIDGALYYNNPIRVANQERKLLWPDVESQPPDIVLSIGTSFAAETKSTANKLTSWMKPNFFQVAFNRFDNILDAQNAWDQFYEEVREPSSTVGQRYIRLNPELQKKVKLDKVDELPWLREAVRGILRTPKWKFETKMVAHRLVASSFFFEKASTDAEENTIQGSIYCRFPDESPELRFLGQHFQNLQSARFSPHFIITEQHQEQHGTIATIPKEMVTSMIQESTFSIEKLAIRLSSKLAKTTISLCFSKDEEIFPISGFPRHLITEEVTGAATKQAQNQAEKRYGSLRKNAPNTATQNGQLTSSLTIPITTVQEGEESPVSDSIPDDIPFWARGHRGHFRQKSSKSLRLKKIDADLPDAATHSKSPTVRELHSANSQGSFGGLFRWGNSSQVAQTEPNSSNETLSRELSAQSLPEIRMPDMAGRRPTVKEGQRTSDSQINPSFSMRVRGHERQLSEPSRPQPQASSSNTTEARRRHQVSPSQSLRMQSRSSSSREHDVSPQSATTNLHRTPSNSNVNNLQYTSQARSETIQPTALVRQKRIEDMTEEEQMELALRESAALVPPYSDRRNETSRPIFVGSMFEGISNTEAAYSTTQPESRHPRYWAEERSSRPENSVPRAQTSTLQSIPSIIVPRTDQQLSPGLEISNSRENPQNLSELAGPEDMTEEELIQLAIAESLKVS